MAEKISDYIASEVQGLDLTVKFIQNRNQVVNCTGLNDQEYRELGEELRGLRLVEFEEFGHFPFPNELSKQLDKSQSNIAMGMFAEIGRAWMSIDSDLFLWNFITNDDLVYFDGITETIVKVELVHPKVSIVDSSIHFIVVVVTSSDIVLLGMTFRGDDKMVTIPRNFEIDYVNTDIMIMNEPLFVTPLDIKSVQYVTGTYDGRIFCGGQDSLIEIKYHAGTWFRSKGIEKVNHSKTILSSFLPGMPFFKNVEEIVQIEVDDTRHFLYTLGDRGTITLYDMSADGDGLEKVKTLSLNEIQKEIRNSCGVEEDYLAAVVYIRAIHTTESNYIVLEAVTSKALRIHFTAYFDGFSQSDIHPVQARAQGLRVVHVRYPPNELFGIHRGAQIYTACGDSETLFVSQLTENECLLTAFSSLNFKFVELPIENVSNAHLEGSVWAFARQPVIQKAFTPPTAATLPPVRAPWIVQQHDIGAQKTYVLTSEGTYVFLQNSPIQLFRKIIGGDSVRHFKWLLEQHGPTEVCVMALTVICSNDPTDISLLLSATSAFFEAGGIAQIMIGPDLSFQQSSIANLSQLRTPPRYTSTPTSPKPQAILNQTYSDSTDSADLPAFEHIAPSARHDALYVYFTRIVSPLWERKVAIREGTYAVNGLPLRIMTKVIDQIGAFIAAIERHNLIEFNSSGQLYDAVTAKAVEKEVQSLNILKNIAVSTHDVLRLWRILDEHQFHVITQLLSADALSALVNMTLGHCVGSSREVASELVTCVIKYYIGDEATTELISTRMSEECPTLFTPQDAYLLKASEFITRARRLPSGHEQAQTVQKAVEIIHKCIQRVNMELVSSLLRQVHGYDYIAELSLVRASKEDPMNLANVAYRESLENVEPRVQDAINNRNAAYKYIVDTLDYLNKRISGNGSSDAENADLSTSMAQIYRDEVISRVLQSDDELAQVCLFKWLLQNGLENRLLQQSHRFFETFLCQELQRAESKKYLELLWKYYEKNENYARAAELLYKYAETARAISLKTRLIYLSHALLCIQSAAETKTNLALKQDIKARLDVAQIQQMIYDEICSESGLTTPLSKLELELYNLTDLYTQFADVYNLPKIKLAILKCANHKDVDTINDIWRDILRKDLAGFESDPPESAIQIQQRLSVTLSKLYRMYSSSVEYVPLKFILRELFFKSLGRAPASWVPQICKESSIPIAAALDVASNEFQTDNFWKTASRVTYMVDFVKYVCDDVLRGRLSLNFAERALLAEKALTFIGTLILNVEHQPGRDVHPIVVQLKVYEEQFKNLV